MPRASKDAWELNPSGWRESVKGQKGSTLFQSNFYPTQAKSTLEWALRTLRRVILKYNFRGSHRAHHKPAQSRRLHHAGRPPGSAESIAPEGGRDRGSRGR